jgi:hypothetical protein
MSLVGDDFTIFLALGAEKKMRETRYKMDESTTDFEKSEV